MKIRKLSDGLEVRERIVSMYPPDCNIKKFEMVSEFWVNGVKLCEEVMPLVSSMERVTPEESQFRNHISNLFDESQILSLDKNYKGVFAVLLEIFKLLESRIKTDSELHDHLLEVISSIKEDVVKNNGTFVRTGIRYDLLDEFFVLLWGYCTRMKWWFLNDDERYIYTGRLDEDDE
jgi:hypothetical protein